MDQRQKFEEMMKGRGRAHMLSRAGGHEDRYADPIVEGWWFVWQAASAEATKSILALMEKERDGWKRAEMIGHAYAIQTVMDEVEKNSCPREDAALGAT
ncbi:hypothetical protein [Cupriavidus sp. D384]|uniref:hypothetical protein n=1 Tax=Cupriavidus sp. D384 TaxID=1538095 RepID=UPI0008374D01|nr:hypothetical protein [Cupriavidus sp. D384]